RPGSSREAREALAHGRRHDAAAAARDAGGVRSRLEEILPRRGDRSAVSGNPILESATDLLELIEGKWTTQAIGVAAELGIADLISSGTDEVGALASATGCDAEALGRLMRALVS